MIYTQDKIWTTIDIEEITDTNFNLLFKKDIKLDYSSLISKWIDLHSSLNKKSTCFVLGSFAKKYPDCIKNLSDNGHEIASHGMNHQLIYNLSIKDWENSLIESKNILEDLTSKKVSGYRSASWSLLFEKKYYEILAKCGYEYSSSYFPLKTYMYGNCINKKEPFIVKTQNGNILEIPIVKNIIPFSGGFYLRVLPFFIQKILLRNLHKNNYKPIIYIHPYELVGDNLMKFYFRFFKINIDFILAFYSSSRPIDKVKKMIKCI